MTELDSSEGYSSWWSTKITDIRPNKISMRGYPIEELIGRVSFSSMLYLMVRSELPTESHVRLLEAAMVASVDHGPQAPSIAAARMAATCGVPFNSIIASGVSLLGDVHGGAGQQCMAFLYSIEREVEAGGDPKVVVHDRVQQLIDAKEFVPGFGHRYHKVDPRAVRLDQLVQEEKNKGTISGKYAGLAALVAEELSSRKGRLVPTNIDGATAVIYSELGFSPELGRAIFILSRSVGIIANSWEEIEGGARLKGPMPKEVLPRYDGPTERHLTF